MHFQEIVMPTGSSIRNATNADISFLARIEYEASLPPLNRCFWEDILHGTDTGALPFIEAMLRVGGGNWGNVGDFWILEDSGQPVGAAAGYTPNQEDYCPLRLSCLKNIAQDLGWSVETTIAFSDRYEQYWGGNYQPVFLTPQAPWIIENVALLPEYRGRGLGKTLLQALLAVGRSQQHSLVGIMVINGNDVARHTYESLGFQPYETFYAAYFRDRFQIEFPGVTKFGLCFN
jgi:ribosomal protein S18 acetylase RimI-like enzyme